MKAQCVKNIRDFSKGRKILVLKGDWEGEETDYVEMVRADGRIPADDEEPGKDLRMRVKTRFGTTLDLIAGHFMWVDKKIIQRPKQN